MWWGIGTAANLVVAVAYLAIVGAILVPLAREHQIGSNRLGSATALIFFTCAIHHGGHAVHMLLPYVGVEKDAGTAMRVAYEDGHMAVWDVLTAAVGIYYWTLRRTYSSLMKGAKLFEDMRERQQRALEINDNIVQGLAEAQLALALGEHEQSAEALSATLASARHIITDLVGEAGSDLRLGAGDLRRTAAAAVAAKP